MPDQWLSKLQTLRQKSIQDPQTKFVSIVFIALSAWGFALIIHINGWLESIELQGYDQLSRWVIQSDYKSDNVVLIEVDQASLDAARQGGVGWPWPRQMYAPIVRFVHEAGARAIVFDILYTEPSVFGSEDDPLLGKAIAESKQVILPIFLSRQGRSIGENERQFLQKFGSPSLDHNTTYQSIQIPIKDLWNNAAAVGNVEIPPDNDGIYRRMPMVYNLHQHQFASLGLATWLYPENISSLKPEQSGLKHNNQLIPLDQKKQFLLTYYGTGREFPRYSAFNVLQAHLALQEGREAIYSKDLFKDKIIFIGLTASGLFDLKPTPVSSVYPGMAVHATLVENLLRGDFRQRAPIVMQSIAGLLLTLLTSVTIIALKGVWTRLFWSFVYFALTVALVITLFHWNIWLNGLFMLLCFGFAFIFSNTLVFITQGYQERQIRGMFSHYMSNVLLDELLKHPEKLRLGGEKRVLTVLFSDITNFTAIAERLSPEQVVGLLNRYLTAMSDIILSHGGIIDKFEGDAIMAFWGAPVAQDEHAYLACKAALENQQRLAALREELVAEGLPELYCRIGINSGEMLIGNMGSHNRFDFTVIGDNVNLAARLEGCGKRYHVGVIISEATYAKIKDQFETRELDQVYVQGKSQSVRIYEVMAEIGQLNPKQLAIKKVFRQGLECYRARQWREAINYFQQALELVPNDGPSQLFIERCHQFLIIPPDNDWNGISHLPK